MCHFNAGTLLVGPRRGLIDVEAVCGNPGLSFIATYPNTVHITRGLVMAVIFEIEANIVRIYVISIQIESTLDQVSSPGARCISIKGQRHGAGISYAAVDKGPQTSVSIARCEIVTVKA